MAFIIVKLKSRLVAGSDDAWSNGDGFKSRIFYINFFKSDFFY